MVTRTPPRSPQKLHKTEATKKGWYDIWRRIPDAANYVRGRSDNAPFMKVQYTPEGEVEFADLFDPEGELLDTTERNPNILSENNLLVMSWLQRSMKELRLMKQTERVRRYFPDLVLGSTE